MEFKCVFCQKTKPKSDFSKYLLQKHSENPSKVLQCMVCSAGAIRTQLKCSMCARKLKLNEFSKTQRKSRNPRCLKCLNTCLNEDIWVTSSDDDE